MKIYAELVRDEYSDLALGYKYEVDYVMRDYIVLIKNRDAKRRYQIKCFKFTDEEGRPLKYSFVKFMKQRYGSLKKEK